MTVAPAAISDAVTGRDQLIAYVESGCKPAESWRIGTEHEKFAFDLKTYRPIPYEGENGVDALLHGMLEFGWNPVHEGKNVIALSQPDGSSVSLEPGGQIELSGAPLRSIHETCVEVHEHLRQVRKINDRLGIGMLGLGFNPLWAREDIPWMPKGRYAIMKRYMQIMGNLGLDMMSRTCTVQVNLDFSSEADMVRKFRVSLALQPVATALFANSPFKEGKPNGFQSYRSHIWTDTDPDRTGDLPFVFEDGFGFERWVDYILDVPMYFVYRDGKYLDHAGKSFRDFMDGKLEGFEGERPHMGDWSDHMTTVFPEVRMKKFLEMRGADGGPWERLCALPAFWVGLLYDGDALTAAYDLIADFTEEERAALRRDVPRLGLKTPFRGGTVQDLARKVLEIARHGLARRARLGGMGETEEHFLDPLIETAESGVTPADRLLEQFETSWGGTVEPVFKVAAY